MRNGSSRISKINAVTKAAQSAPTNIATVPLVVPPAISIHDAMAATIAP